MDRGFWGAVKLLRKLLDLWVSGHVVLLSYLYSWACVLRFSSVVKSYLYSSLVYLGVSDRHQPVVGVWTTCWHSFVLLLTCLRENPQREGEVSNAINRWGQHHQSLFGKKSHKVKRKPVTPWCLLVLCGKMKSTQKRKPVTLGYRYLPLNSKKYCQLKILWLKQISNKVDRLTKTETHVICIGLRIVWEFGLSTFGLSGTYLWCCPCLC